MGAKVYLNRNILLSFIDYSFQEHRKIFKMKQREESITDIKLI